MGTGGFLAVTVNTGAVTLTPGTNYIALFTTIGQTNTSTTGVAFGRVTSDATPNSAFFYNNGNSLAALSGGQVWNDNGSFGELAFSMQFGSAAPAAASVPDNGTTALLLGVGFIGLFAFRRYAPSTRGCLAA